MRARPNWPIFAMALPGMALTAYLTVSAWSGQAVAGCSAGSPCDIVLSSRWAKLLGLPTSFWGFLAYASLAAIAFIKGAERHWKLAWIVSLWGALYSLYLTSVALIELKAACPYCLASSLLMLVILGTVLCQQPGDLPKFSWRPWLFKTVAGGLVVLLALHLYYAGVWGRPEGPEDPGVRALAEHLARSGAKFYGAYWCSHCQEQKEMFGESAHRLPYIECSPQGRAGPRAFECQVEDIRSYPTWIIHNRRYEGVLSLKQLADVSGFKGDF